MLKTTKPAVPFALLLLLGIVAISFSSIFIKWSAAPVSVIAMYRLFLTNLIMLPLLRKYRHELIQIQLRDGFKLIWSGFCLGLHFLFWMGSLRFTSVASSTAILTLEPILVMLGSFLMFRLRTNWITVISMMVAISGAALMGWGDFQFSGAALQGDLLSFLGAATVAVHMLLGKNLRNHISAYVYSFFVFFIAGAVLAVYNLFSNFSFIAYDPKEWGIFLLLAIIPTIFGHYLFNWLLKYMKATSVSMAVLGEPLGASILALFLLGEQITRIQLAAGAVLIFGVWIFIKSNQLSNKNQ